MKVILLKDVPKVGQKNEIKDVKDGFALNMLFPKKLAIKATEGSIKHLEKIREKTEVLKKENLKEIEEKISSMKVLTIKSKANEKGHLFAGINKETISDKMGIPVESIVLEHPLKEIGEHDVSISVGDKTLKIKVVIEAE